MGAATASDDRCGPARCPTRLSTPSAAKITAASLREKRRRGMPITVSEIIFVYRIHTRAYYQKNGVVTREAGVIDDALASTSQMLRDDIRR